MSRSTASAKAGCACPPDVRATVAKEIRAGKTQEQVVAANLTKQYDAQYGKGFITPTVFVQRAYVDLKRTVK